MDMHNIAAIVTGGASGLGKATATMLAARGARVAILDLNEAAASAAAQDLGGLAFALNVADDAAVAAALDAAARAHGIARILVNCAGVAPAAKTVGKDNVPHALDLFRRTVEGNLIGSFNLISQFAARAVAADDVSGERGVIVNTASVAAYDGQVGQAAYAASKGGVVGMTLPIARDLSAVGIRVNTIAPGLIDTPIYGEGEQSEAFKAHLGQSVLFPKRLGSGEELAFTVMECITNPYLNAETIRLDGGIRMPPK